MKKSKSMYNLCIIIPYIILSILLIFFIADCINIIRTRGIAFDDSYNAQVAANFSRTGIYKVSYPSDIIFYNKITTGQNILLVTALIYKIWGISVVTTEIASLIYSVFSLIVAFLFFKKILLKYTISPMLSVWLAVIGLVIFIGCASALSYTSTSLLGESCALFFILLSFLFIEKYSDNKNLRLFIVAGIFASSALIAKTIAICFLVTSIGIILFEIIIRNMSRKSIIYYIIGLVIGIIIWDSFKWWQLGKNFYNWGQWWIAEVANAQNQSNATSLFHNCTLPQIRSRYDWIANTLFRRDKFQTFILLIAPLVSYFVTLIVRIRAKSKELQWLALHMLGLGGTSLIIYMLLFGGSGLMAEPRRLCVYANCVWVFNLSILLLAIGRIIVYSYSKSMCKKLTVTYLITSLLILSIYSYNTISFYFQMSKKDMASEQLVKAELMSQRILELPDNSKIYTYGWWQAPELSLLTQKKFYPQTDLISCLEETDWEAAYFVVGNFIHSPDGYDSVKSWLEQYCDVETLYKAPNPYESSKGHTTIESNTIYKLNAKGGYTNG